MKLARRLLAALVLSVWLLAIGHVALEHCAAMNGACAVACTPAEEMPHEPHSDEPGGAEAHHHHHFIAWAVQLVKVVDGKTLMPAWLPLNDVLADRLTALLREMAATLEPVEAWDSPPDERSSGWLLLCQTAHPVRGPSLPA